MPEYPKISIITPSFNQGRFIEETILSVINQDYTNIEYIIIDGGSTDDSVNIIRKYEKKIAYFVSEPDQGHRYALKKGFDRATGEIVAWQNSDDYYEPNVFGEVLKIFSARPEVDLVYGNVRFINEESKQIGEMRFVPAHHWLMFSEKFTMHNQAAFFRRSLWDAMGGITFNDYFFDVDLFIRACRFSKKAFFLHRILGNYRNHTGSGYFGGQLVHLQTDTWVILKRYLGGWGKLPKWAFIPVRWASLVTRTMLHMWLGDWDYLEGGFIRRISHKLHSRDG
ncbi:MAG: glycosyltransferase [Bacteroidetes bacterium]|nr:glycosyltransferase [Bacteroidota bacterium]